MSGNTITRLMDRVGITWRLLVPSLLALAIGVALVLTITLNDIASADLHREESLLSGCLKLLQQHIDQAAPPNSDWEVADGHLSFGHVPLAGRDDLVDSISVISGAVATIFDGDVRIATSVRGADGKRGVNTRLAQGPVYEAVLTSGHAYQGRNLILGTPYLTHYEPLRNAAGKVVGVLFVGVPISEAEEMIAQATSSALRLAVIVVLAVGGLCWYLLRANIRPMTEMAKTMGQISAGRLDVAIVGATRRDQIGVMARALTLLRDTARSARDLEERSHQSSAHSEAEKRTALVKMAEVIELETNTAIARVGERNANMILMADSMALSSDRSSANAERAKVAASEALLSVDAVAAAAEQLAHSIQEISGQVSRTSEVVHNAVHAGESTRGVFHALNAQVDKIGAVAGIIADIAAKTNLLALNATIEAARAGEAGRGFAVVADEVKQLAVQTAHSTTEISTFIRDVRNAASEAVGAVQGIEKTITQIDAISASVAAAVEEQGAATAEIARSVTSTAQSARDVSQLVALVADESMQIRQNATEVRASSEALGHLVSDLRGNVVDVLHEAVRKVA